MKPKNIKINFDLNLNVNRDSNLYHAIRDTPVEDCGALLREYIDRGISAEYTESYIESRIEAALSSRKKQLKTTTNKQQL